MSNAERNKMKILKRRVSVSAFILIALCLTGSLSEAQINDVLVIHGGRILTVSHGEIDQGMLLVRNGKIEKVGKEFKIPDNARILEARDSWIIPGMIESHSTLGARSRYLGSNADEVSDPNTAQLKIVDGINPFNKDLKYTRMAGITSGMITPGRQNVIGGQTAVVKFRGKTVTEMVLREPAGLKFSLGEGPKTTYGSKGRLPSTRMGSAYVIRNALLEAENYIRLWDSYKKRKSKDKDVNAPKRDLRLEPLAKVRR
jgi:imidazolonepropionase-like amidohydrolase